jgi:hypothetical protein
MAPVLFRNVGRLGGGVRAWVLADFCDWESRTRDAQSSSKTNQNGAERHFLLSDDWAGVLRVD